MNEWISSTVSAMVTIVGICLLAYFIMDYKLKLFRNPNKKKSQKPLIMATILCMIPVIRWIFVGFMAVIMISVFITDEAKLKELIEKHREQEGDE